MEKSRTNEIRNLLLNFGKTFDKKMYDIIGKEADFRFHLAHHTWNNKNMLKSERGLQIHLETPLSSAKNWFQELEKKIEIAK